MRAGLARLVYKMQVGFHDPPRMQVGSRADLFFFLERRGGVEAVAVCINNCRRSHAESQAERAAALQRKVSHVLCAFFWNSVTALCFE